MEFNWNDLKKLGDGFSFNNVAGEKTSGNKKKMDENEGEATSNTDLLNMEVLDWSEMRKFDDDHDDDWFKAQENKLAEQYGGNFLKVKYCSNGRVAYFCELCVAECNAKKSLEAHCVGMKHLKKKDLWEKEGRPPPSTLSSGGKNENSKPARELSPEPVLPAHLKPPKKKGKGGRAGFGFNTYDKNSFDGSGGGGGYDRFLPPNDPYYQPFAPPPPPVPDLRDTIDALYSERDYDPYSTGRGIGRVYDDDLRGRSPKRRSPVRPRYYGDSIEPVNRDYKVRSRDKFARNGRTKSRSRSRERDSRRSRSWERRRSLDDRRSRSPPYKAPVPPSPPKFNLKPTGNKVNLVTSPAGSLLQKLSECCVKTSEDSDLAMNVVTSLVKSLKEYSDKNKESRITELLTEAELKLGTVKALKVGMKMLSSLTDSSSSSAQGYGARSYY